MSKSDLAANEVVAIDEDVRLHPQIVADGGFCRPTAAVNLRSHIGDDRARQRARERNGRGDDVGGRLAGDNFVGVLNAGGRHASCHLLSELGATVA